MAAPVRKTFNICREVRVDDATLKKIAEALGIPESEQDRIISISGEIRIGPSPTPASGSAPPTSRAGGSPPIPPSGDDASATTRRQQE